MEKNPYALLGVKANATQEEIKKAYRSLAKKHHPDLNPGNKQNEKKFKEISHAYDQIGTKEAREKFDRGETAQRTSEHGHAGRQWSDYYKTQQNSGRYSQNFADSFADEDFFEQIFGRSSSGTSTHSQRKANEDLHYRMEILFAEAILGTEKKITLPNGKSLNVKIPAGIEEGIKLRFKGLGSESNPNLPAGDAYIQILIKNDPAWIRQGDDVQNEISISFFEAILGGVVAVPTLEGSVLLTIPPGVSTGTKLRIKGKGVVREKAKGDQYVLLKVMTPKKAEPQLIQELKKLEPRFHYNPREIETDSNAKGSV